MRGDKDGVPFRNVVSPYRFHCPFNSGRVVVDHSLSEKHRKQLLVLSLSPSLSVPSVSDLCSDLIKELIEHCSPAPL